MKKYLPLVLVVLIAAPLLVAGCTSPSNPSPAPSAATQNVNATATVPLNASAATSSATPASFAAAIRDFSFQPSAMTIPRRASLTWRNDDSVAHNVVSDSNAFSSPVLNPGATYSHKFDQPGTYPYHCSIHPSMTGSITVQ